VPEKFQPGTVTLPSGLRKERKCHFVYQVVRFNGAAFFKAELASMLTSTSMEPLSRKPDRKEKPVTAPVL